MWPGASTTRCGARFWTAHPRWLSLDFSGEACGAYCEEFTHTRVFDLRDGRQLSLGDLLTVKGFTDVGRRVDAQRQRAYRQQLRLLQVAQKNAKGLQDSETDDADRLALNKACLKRVAAEPSTPESARSCGCRKCSDCRRWDLPASLSSSSRCGRHVAGVLSNWKAAPGGEAYPWIGVATGRETDQSRRSDQARANWMTSKEPTQNPCQARPAPSHRP